MNEHEIKTYDNKLEDLTRSLRSSGASKKPRSFLCPILQMEEPALLCKGHIVPKAVRGRTWVVQRRDVDNFYGQFAEAGFIHGVRLRAMPTFDDAVEYILKHRLARRADLSVIDGTGARAPVHRAPRHAAGRELMIRSGEGAIDLDGELSLTMDLDVRFETLLTCLHTAHLGLFQASGYAYATSASGRFVANLLRDVYLQFARQRRSSQSLAERNHLLAAMCRTHANMVRPLQSIDGFHSELLPDPFRTFLLCWCGERVFASVHLLHADSEWNAVMQYADVDQRAIAMMASTTPVSFKATLGRLENGVIRAAPVQDDSSTIAWPCGEEGDPTQAIPIERMVARLPWPSR